MACLRASTSKESFELSASIDTNQCGITTTVSTAADQQRSIVAHGTKLRTLFLFLSGGLKKSGIHIMIMRCIFIYFVIWCRLFGIISWRSLNVIPKWRPTKKLCTKMFQETSWELLFFGIFKQPNLFFLFGLHQTLIQFSYKQSSTKNCNEAEFAANAFFRSALDFCWDCADSGSRT